MCRLMDCKTKRTTATRQIRRNRFDVKRRDREYPTLLEYLRRERADDNRQLHLLETIEEKFKRSNNTQTLDHVK